MTPYFSAKQLNLKVYDELTILVHDVQFLTPSHQEPQATKTPCVSFLLRQFVRGFFSQTHENTSKLKRDSIEAEKSPQLLCFEYILLTVVVKFDEIRR